MVDPEARDGFGQFASNDDSNPDAVDRTTMVPRLMEPAPYWSAPPPGGTVVQPNPLLNTPTQPIHAQLLARPSARAVVVGPYLAQPLAKPPSHELGRGEPLEIARAPGTAFADDPYVERRHATLTALEDGVRVDDLDSQNGVFRLLTTPTPLPDGAHFILGDQLLAFRSLDRHPPRSDARPFGSPDPGYWGRIDVMLAPWTAAASYPIDEAEVILGREVGQVQFPDDACISRRHCRIVTDTSCVHLEDIGSVHGTYFKLTSGTVVPYGTILLIGRTLLRLET
jgi:hypothetical protein